MQHTKLKIWWIQMSYTLHSSYSKAHIPIRTTELFPYIAYSYRREMGNHRTRKQDQQVRIALNNNHVYDSTIRQTLNKKCVHGSIARPSTVCRRPHGQARSILEECAVKRSIYEMKNVMFCKNQTMDFNKNLIPVVYRGWYHGLRLFISSGPGQIAIIDDWIHCTVITRVHYGILHCTSSFCRRMSGYLSLKWSLTLRGHTVRQVQVFVTYTVICI